jgi:hypothetical protein
MLLSLHIIVLTYYFVYMLFSCFYVYMLLCLHWFFHSNENKIICKQNNMEAKEHVNIEIQKKQCIVLTYYFVYKVICLHVVFVFLCLHVIVFTLVFSRVSMFIYFVCRFFLCFHISLVYILVCLLFFVVIVAK